MRQLPSRHSSDLRFRDYILPTHGDVLCCSVERQGENDAWLVATAESIDADVVAADRTAFERLGARYVRFQ